MTTNGFLPAGLLQKLKDFDADAPNVIMNRAEELQEQDHKRLSDAAFKSGVRAVFSLSALRGVIDGMAAVFAPPANGFQHSVHSPRRESPSGLNLNFDAIWPYWRQAINEYIDMHDFPRDTLNAPESSWLVNDADRPATSHSGAKPS